jgi:hypothetical protein
MLYLISKIQVRDIALESALLHQAIDDPEKNDFAGPGRWAPAAEIVELVESGDMVFCISFLGDKDEYDLGDRVTSSLQSIDADGKVTESLWQLPRIQSN